MSLQAILEECSLTGYGSVPVHGGDINRAYCLTGQAEKYFLKVNEADRYPGMFEKEAQGLNALKNSSTLVVPGVIRSGVVGKEQYLLMQWLEKGSAQSDFWEKFGNGLALLHKREQASFGWPDDNYIGSLPQRNTGHDQWHLFYAECRILPLVKVLVDEKKFTKQEMVMATSFCKKLEELFPPEPPSLLHGDLWAGNYMITANGEAAIFDPAVYNGHREMDIGMTKLFGGFDRVFYEAYNQTYPLQQGWQQRLSLMQLYPLLVHAVLFGGHYVSAAREIIREYI